MLTRRSDVFAESVRQVFHTQINQLGNLNREIKSNDTQKMVNLEGIELGLTLAFKNSTLLRKSRERVK